jgi:hypothetical protein
MQPPDIHNDLVTEIFDWLVDPEPTGHGIPDYAFRYMSSEGLAATIDNRQLRMNAWTKMNDPREALQWSPTGPLAGVGGYKDWEMWKRLDDVLRRSACLLSMTADRERSPYADPSSLFHRGWGRAPLWAHYAANHRGVCVLLDPAEIYEAVNDIPAKNGRYSAQARIKYVDKPIQINLTGFFADQSSLDRAIVDLLDTRWEMSGLHLTKNTDWSYETELRIAVVKLHLGEHELDTPVYIPLGNCLKAVIFGDLHPIPEAVADAINSVLPNPPEFFKCHWIGGAPTLVPLTV